MKEFRGHLSGLRDKPMKIILESGSRRLSLTAVEAAQLSKVLSEWLLCLLKREENEVE